MTAPSRPWTAADLAALARLYPDHSAASVGATIGRAPGSVYNQAKRLGIQKSAAFYASQRSGRIQRGQQNAAMQKTQFKPGTEPWNKGTHFHAGGRSVDTQFQTGRPASDAKNYKPIGSYRLNKEGHLERKFTDDRSLFPSRRWEPVYRSIWIAAHGPLPPGHIVVFKPGRRTNQLDQITLDCLECISRSENARRNHPAAKSAELGRLVQLKGAITRQINRRIREAKEATT